MARPIGPTFELGASQQVLRALDAAITAAPQKAYKTALRVLNRSLRRGKSQASKRIRDVLNLKKKAVDARITTKVISQRSLVGSLAVRDKKLELIEFMTPTQIASAWRRQNQRRRRSRGVKVKVYKQRPAAVYPETFVNIGTGRGRWHVFKREGVDRYPIFIRYGPALTAQYEKDLPKFAQAQSDYMERELNRLLLNGIDIT